MEGKQEILEAISAFSTLMDTRLSTIEHDISLLQTDMKGVKSSMITKDYLDRKMAEQKFEIWEMIKKEDDKVNLFASMVHENGCISDQQKKELFRTEPFPECMT